MPSAVRRVIPQPTNIPSKPRGAPVHQILSIQRPAAVQSGSLWRDPCFEGTLAGNYRVGPDYHVDYSPQESHPAEQSQTPHAYDTHSHHRGNPMQQHTGHGSLHEQSQSHSHSHHAMSQHHPSHHHPHHQILMDPGHLGGHPGTRHMGHQPSHYAPGPSPHAVVGPPLYPAMTPTQPHSAGSKRGRPDDLDLSVPGIPDLEQGDLDSMQQSSMGAAYAQAAGSAPTHHHHRLPDQGPPSKMMRREGDGSIGGSGGGAPSVVGQAGMPPPAPRPRGPKLKFTPEDDALLIDLKENKSLTWKQIADFFPGRSSGTLQVRYCTKLKAKTTQWTDETDQKLRTALQDYENEKWRFVSNKVGPGFTPQACRERAAQLLGGEVEEAMVLAEELMEVENLG
ncbi:MYB DNA-binding domain-containing protein [Camillea tinctor]|nr:MYB DNA-binding domain-containing protein [Camillea tinctor]